ncbi:MAG: glycosyltransferase family 4 protein [Thermoleophilia bacterium]|nr:glycosyltransferase family 4 protein [Thermoleophilia bacterium]
MSRAPGPVLVDCRMARRRETGGARYARELAARLPGEHDVRVVYGPPPLPRRNALTTLGNLLLDLAWTHIALPALAARHRAAAIHSTFNWAPAWAPCPRVVTVHDLSWEHMPEAYPAGFRAYARVFTRASSRRADRVIAVSRATADDLTGLYGVRADRIDVVYTGVDGIGVGGPADTPRERVVLHVGEFEPRKRVPTLIEGFARFAGTPAGRGWRMVLAGRGGADAERVAALVDATPGVEALGFVGDDALRRLYGSSALLASVSRFEGFCLPVAEALAQGCPVMVARTPALVEAGGGDAVVVDEPVDAAAVAAALERATADPGALAARGARGRDHAAAFTWDACVAGTVASYDAAGRARGAAA